jgi:ABC-type nitrate/sulfonate/bicarbonate transport system ATPase subunit
MLDPMTDQAESLGLICDRVSHVFENRRGAIEALDGITLRARPHEFICVVGPSGCGKSTLLKIVAGLLAPTSGRVEFGNGGPSSANGGVARRPRNALVFQEHGVFPWMTVRDNVAFGLEMQRVARSERHERALAFLDRVGLGGFADNYPHELSVGMRQRVGIARAFVADVPILLMDEPFGSLDAQTKLLLQEELLRIWREDRKLVLFVTHDLEEAVRLGDRVLVMTGRPGRIREEIPVTVPRPRSGVRDPRQVAESAWHIWQLLRDEARRSFSAPS